MGMAGWSGGRGIEGCHGNTISRVWETLSGGGGHLTLG